MGKGTGVFMPRSYDDVTAGRSEGQQHANRTVAPTQQHLGSRAISSQSCRPGHDGDAAASRSTVRGGTTANSLRTFPGGSKHRSCSLPFLTSELCEDAIAWHSLSHSYSSSLGDHTLPKGSPLGLGHLDECGSMQPLQVAAAAANQPSMGAGRSTSTSSSKLYTTELGWCVPASHCQDHRHSVGAQHSSWCPSSALAAAAPSFSRRTAQQCSSPDYPGSLGSPTGRHMPLASAGGHRCTAAAGGAMALAAGGQGPPAAAAGSSSSSSSFALQPQNSIGWQSGPSQGPSSTGTALTDPFMSTGKRVGMHPAVLQLGQHTKHGCSAPLQPEQQQQQLQLVPSPAATVEPGSLPDTLMLLQQQLAAAHLGDTGPDDDAAAASGTVSSLWSEALTSSCSHLDRSLMAASVGDDTRLSLYQQQQQQKQQQGFGITSNPVGVAGSAGASYGLSSLFDSSCGSLLDLPQQAQTQQEEAYAAPASGSVGAAGSLTGSSQQGAFQQHDVGALAAVVAQQKIQQMAVLDMLQQKLQQEVVNLLPFI